MKKAKISAIAGLLILTACSLQPAAPTVPAKNVASNQTVAPPRPQATSMPARNTSSGSGAQTAPSSPLAYASSAPGMSMPVSTPDAAVPPLPNTTGDAPSQIEEISQPVTPQETNYLYLSYDDSASTVGVELTKYSLMNGQLPYASWARPWEFLNYEKIATTNKQNTGLFDISMGLWKEGDAATSPYHLGVQVSSPELDKLSRRNLNLTVVIDVSGSMAEHVSQTADAPATDLLGLCKSGLNVLADESLKTGDVINLVTFSDSAKTVLEGFTYDGTNANELKAAIARLALEGSTNLNAGVDEGYRIALRHFKADKINRVVMMTDAFANSGEIDPNTISSKTRVNNAEGVYFSGIGLGAGFNEAFLDKLTEAGKGSYYTMLTPFDAKRTFDDRLMALLNVAARNVQFRLDYPSDLAHKGSAAEQVSQNQAEVLPTNFSYNTSQFFLESFGAKGSSVNQSGEFQLTIEYSDTTVGERKTAVYRQSIAQILGQNTDAVKDAYSIVLLNKLMKGEETSESVKATLGGSLAGHETQLGTEYRRLIEKMMTLQSSPVASSRPVMTDSM